MSQMTHLGFPVCPLFVQRHAPCPYLCQPHAPYAARADDRCARGNFFEVGLGEIKMAGKSKYLNLKK